MQYKRTLILVSIVLLHAAPAGAAPASKPLPTAADLVQRYKARAQATGTHSLKNAPLSTRAYQDRRSRLRQASSKLKQQFFGQDRAIDSLIRQITGWYLRPEDRTGTTVVTVVGPTGVGKSAIISALLAELGLSGALRTFNMEGLAGESGELKPVNFLFPYESRGKEFAMIPEVRTYELPDELVLLINEIDKAPTKDPMGQSIARPAAQALFDLLGNAKQWVVNNPMHETFVSQAKNPSLMGELIFDQQERELRTELLRDTARGLLEYTPSSTTIDLTGTLVFQTGNVPGMIPDGAWDLSADELHSHTSRYRPSNALAAFSRIHRQDVLTRMTSNLLVMPSLNEQAYRDLIAQQIELAQQRAAKMGLRLQVSGRLVERIYNEVIDPAQGARNLDTKIGAFFTVPIIQLAEERQELITSGKLDATATTVAAADIEHLAESSRWQLLGDNGALLQEPREFTVTSEWARWQRPRPHLQERLRAAARLAARTILEVIARRTLPTGIVANSPSATIDGHVRFPVTTEDDEPDFSFADEQQLVLRAAAYIAPLIGERAMTESASLRSRQDLQNLTTYLVGLVGEAGITAGNPRRPPLHLKTLGVDTTFEVSELASRALKQAKGWLTSELTLFRKLAALLGSDQRYRLDQDELRQLFADHASEALKSHLRADPADSLRQTFERFLTDDTFAAASLSEPVRSKPGFIQPDTQVTAP